MAAAALNEEIQSVSYYNIRHLAFHGYIGPFAVLYILWFYLLKFVYGVEEYFEIFLIALAVIGLLQILVSLFCLWSVDVRCALTCSKVGIAQQKIFRRMDWVLNSPLEFLEKPI